MLYIPNEHSICTAFIWNIETNRAVQTYGILLNCTPIFADCTTLDCIADWDLTLQTAHHTWLHCWLGLDTADCRSPLTALLTGTWHCWLQTTLNYIADWNLTLLTALPSLNLADNWSPPKDCGVLIITKGMLSLDNYQWFADYWKLLKGLRTSENH